MVEEIVKESGQGVWFYGWDLLRKCLWDDMQHVTGMGEVAPEVSGDTRLIVRCSGNGIMLDHEDINSKAPVELP